MQLMDLTKAFSIAEQDSPASWIAKEALRTMAAEIERLQSRISPQAHDPKIRPIRYLDSHADMLRIWATGIDSGEIDLPDSVLMVVIHNDGRKPQLFQTATAPNNLIAIGALMHSVYRILGVLDDD